jgi:hypothetical protein
VLLALLVPTALLFPIDLLGGHAVVRERLPVPAWLAGWLRGVAVQFAVWAVAAAALLCAARAGGAPAALLAGVALQLALLAARGAIARAAAPLSVTTPAAPLAEAARAAGVAPARVRTVATFDGGFVGGWLGALPGRAVLWVPASWLTMPRPALVAALARRRATLALGLHGRGVLLAVGWNALGLALALVAPGADARTAAGLLTVVAWATLWSFVGLLVLPTPSRRAVHVGDRAAAASHGAAGLREAIVWLDVRQDDEPARPRGVETVFHPVPARTLRLAALDGAYTPPTTLAAHQAARHALYLAWALLSPLSRAVHCNVGRPALWVVWPGD